MSVPEFLRTAGKMQIYTVAKRILIRTRRIITNQKYIPKRQQKRYADRLDNEATELFLCVCSANAIRPATKEDYISRRDFLIKAKVHAEILCYFIDLTYDAGYLRGVSMDCWYSEIDEFLRLLTGLRKRDYERFGKLRDKAVSSQLV